MSQTKFRMGRLDHVHIRVPDRQEAARWYAEHLGFEPVERFDFWATGFEGGPLQISADGGETMLALFEASEGHPMVPQKTGVAFSLDADCFMHFARSLPGGIGDPSGRPLEIGDIASAPLIRRPYTNPGSAAAEGRTHAVSSAYSASSYLSIAEFRIPNTSAHKFESDS